MYFYMLPLIIVGLYLSRVSLNNVIPKVYNKDLFYHIKNKFSYKSNLWTIKFNSEINIFIL